MNKNQPLALTLLLIGLIIPTGVLAFTDYNLDPEGAIKNCRACHDNHRKQLFLTSSNSNAHHLLHNTEIEGSAAPNAGIDSDGLYDCMTCHTPTMTDYGIDITAERDCIKCHGNATFWPDRHHARIELLQNSGAIPESALACFLCHDFEVDENGGLTGQIRFFSK